MRAVLQAAKQQTFEYSLAMDREFKWVAWFLLALGIATMGVAIAQGLAPEGYPPTGSSCRALCGLSLMAATLFGDEIGNGVLAALLFVIGAGGAAVGFKLLRTG